jgi:hypothetical protein
MSYHTVLIPSANNAPNPSGTLLNPDDTTSLPQMNPLQCSYPCTDPGCGVSIDMLYVDPATFDQSQPFEYGPGFTVPNQDYEVSINYNPPLS